MRSDGCKLISMNLDAKNLGWEPLGNVTQALFLQAILSWIWNGKCRLMHNHTGSYLHMTSVCDNALASVVLVTLMYVCTHVLDSPHNVSMPAVPGVLAVSGVAESCSVRCARCDRCAWCDVYLLNDLPCHTSVPAVPGAPGVPESCWARCVRSNVRCACCASCARCAWCA